jgi:hypothetical protein
MNSVQARTAIHPGDKLTDPQGNVWRVLRTMPGGKLDLIDDTRKRLGMFYHREVKLWERDGTKPLQTLGAYRDVFDAGGEQ